MGSHHLRSANLIATPVECQNCGNCANRRRRRGLPSSMPALPTRPGGLLDPGPHASLRCMDGQQRRTRLPLTRPQQNTSIVLRCSLLEHSQTRWPSCCSWIAIIASFNAGFTKWKRIYSDNSWKSLPQPVLGPKFLGTTSPGTLPLLRPSEFLDIEILTLTSPWIEDLGLQLRGLYWIRCPHFNMEDQTQGVPLPHLEEDIKVTALRRASRMQRTRPCLRGHQLQSNVIAPTRWKERSKLPTSS